jgi:hypothetical protein
MTSAVLISTDQDQAGKNSVTGATGLERDPSALLHRDVTTLSHRRAAAFVDAAG